MLYMLSFTNPEPTEISCAEFLEKGSAGKWLKLTNCYRDNSEVMAVYDLLGRITKNSDFYLPLRAKPGNSNTPAKLFLKVNKKDDTIKLAAYANTVGTLKAHKALLKKHPGMEEFLSASGGNALMGMLVFGLDSESGTIKLIQKEGLVVDDFYILDEGEEPSLVLGIFMLVLSFVFPGILGILAYSMARAPK